MQKGGWLPTAKISNESFIHSEVVVVVEGEGDVDEDGVDEDEDDDDDDDDDDDERVLLKGWKEEDKTRMLMW